MRKMGNKFKKERKWNYPAFIDANGDKKTVHARVGEKKYGYEKIPKNFVIHHIDGNKENNQYFNLILLHKKDHDRIHLKKSLVIRSVRLSEEEGENVEIS